MKNIGITSTSYPPAIGGAQIHTHEIAKQLVLQGATVSVLTAWSENRTDWILGTTLKAPLIEKNYVLDKINVLQPALSQVERWSLTPGVCLYYGFPEIASPLMAQGWLRHFRRLPANIELVHNIRIGREHLTEATHRLARERGIPFVLTPNHSPRMNRFVSRRLFHLYRQAEMIFAFTEVEKKQLLDLGVKANHVTVIGAGPVLSEEHDGEEFKKQHGIQGRCVLFVGQKYLYKGYETLLQAAPKVWSEFPDTYFVFVGPNYSEAIPVFERYKDPRLINIGALPPHSKEKASAYAACDVFALPSRQEGFGGVFVEAWAFNKPVVGGDIAPLREIIEENVDGYLVPQDPNVLADRLLRLLRNPALAQELGEAGRRKVQRLYGWDVIAAKVTAGYEQAKRNLKG